ncbi:MAG: hypothetical protein FWF55_01580 [Treponema sp.]|nr:hypothetical protein [Treponema sp.]
MKKTVCLLFLLLPLAVLPAQEPYETNVDFRGFAWGTSMDEVIKKMGKPVSREQIDGLTSLVWENVEVSGFTSYMIAYFSPKGGLQGGTYYFVTRTMDDVMKCYDTLQMELYNRFGRTNLFDTFIKELRPYESSWNLPGGYVYLFVNARLGVPVTLWYSSHELSKTIYRKE